jgi:hypothetical protein
MVLDAALSSVLTVTTGAGAFTADDDSPTALG